MDIFDFLTMIGGLCLFLLQSEQQHQPQPMLFSSLNNLKQTL